VLREHGFKVVVIANRGGRMSHSPGKTAASGQTAVELCLLVAVLDPQIAQLAKTKPERQLRGSQIRCHYVSNGSGSDRSPPVGAVGGQDWSPRR
jgi:hypothetical protein